MKFFDDERQTHFFLFVVRYAGVGVYVDVTGGEDLGMDCSALTVCLIGMLDDVYLDRKLSTMYTICRVRSRGQLVSTTPCAKFQSSHKRHRTTFSTTLAMQCYCNNSHKKRPLLKEQSSES